MKKSQIDAETDKNPQKFPNSKILCSFSPKLSSDFVDWNTEKNQQGKNVLSCRLFRRLYCSFLNENVSN